MGVREEEFARHKPRGFRNCIENVAVVGAGGHIGKVIVEELLRTNKFHVTALTRKESQSVIPGGERVVVERVDYEDQESLVTALQGQQALIITLSSTSPASTQTNLINAAATANVPFVFPNEWGLDMADHSLGNDVLLGEKHGGYRAQIESLGKSCWIGMVCGFWYEYSLAAGMETFGVGLRDREMRFFDQGEVKVSVSTWPQCGRAVARLLGLKILREDEGDEEICLSQYSNTFVYTSSFRVSQKDIFDSILRVTGTESGEWRLSYEESRERYESGMKLMKGGDRMGFLRLMYTRVFYPNGGGDFEKERGLQNEVLGLPKEDLDEFTKVAVKMWEQKGELGRR